MPNHRKEMNFEYLMKQRLRRKKGGTGEALQGKTCQDSMLSGGGRSVRAKISGGRGRLWGKFFNLYKTRHILLSDRANCTVLRAVVLTQYRRVTDGRTDGQTDGQTELL